MLELPTSGHNDELIVAGDRAQITMGGVRMDKVCLRTTTRMPEKIASLPRVRQEKVLSVRQQLAEGKYGINERLTVTIDRLIEGLVTERVGVNDEEGTRRRQ